MSFMKPDTTNGIGSEKSSEPIDILNIIQNACGIMSGIVTINNVTLRKYNGILIIIVNGTLIY